MDRRSAKVRAVLALAMISAGTSGCRQLPSRRKPETNATSPAPIQVIPPLPLIPQPAPPPLREIDNRTPLLDSALKRDEEVRQIVFSGFEASTPAETASIGDEKRPPSVETTSGANRNVPQAALAPFTSEIGEPHPLMAPETMMDAVPASAATLATESGPAAGADPVDPGGSGTANVEENHLSDENSRANTPPTHQEEIATSRTSTPGPVVEPFTSTDLQLCSRVLGPGRVIPLDSNAIRAGDPVILYAAVSGLSCDGSGPSRTQVTLKIELIAEGRDAPSWSLALTDERRSPTPPPREGFVNCRFTPPRGLDPGRYRLRLVVRDELTGRDAEGSLAFDLRR